MPTFTFTVTVKDSSGETHVHRGTAEAEDVDSGPAAGPAILAATRLAVSHTLQHLSRYQLLDDRRCKGPFTVKHIDMLRQGV